MSIERAELGQLDEAFEIVSEYCEAIGVQVRDDRAEFAELYFAERAGLWLAKLDGETVGCIALRPLRSPEQSGEVKRLDVRPANRGSSIAKALLSSLEEYARLCGYSWLYLDTKDDLLPAIEFYKKHGYVACDRYNDNPQATIFMRKQILQR